MDTKTELTKESMVLTSGIKAYLQDRAKREDRSMSAVIRRIVQEAMAADPNYTLPETAKEDGHE